MYILVVDTTMAGLHSLHPISFMNRILYRYSVQASKCSNRCCLAYPLKQKNTANISLLVLKWGWSGLYLCKTWCLLLCNNMAHFLNSSNVDKNSNDEHFGLFSNNKAPKVTEIISHSESSNTDYTTLVPVQILASEGEYFQFPNNLSAIEIKKNCQDSGIFLIVTLLTYFN